MIERPPIEIPELSIYEVLKSTSEQYPQKIAYEYLGQKVSYKALIESVDDFSLRLRALGLDQGDKVIICLPNCPQAVITFYAASRLGAVAVMVHPLSSSNEVEFYVRDSGAKIAVTMSMFADKFPPINDVFNTLIISSAVSTQPFIRRCIAKTLSKQARLAKIERNDYVLWKTVMRMDISKVDRSMPKVGIDDDAAILYTGGTTGKNKGTVHSSRTFNVTAFGMIDLSGIYGLGENMLAEMPMFHGFGLCTCFHLPFCIGLKCIIMPDFTLDSICRTIVKKRINFIAGVPSLFEKIITNKHLQNADLSCLQGLFCGGDSMTVEAKARVDAFLKEHNCPTVIRIGYGCTECLTATCISPKGEERPGSIGVPIPGHKFMIAREDSDEECPDGEDGEICICGAAVMSRYLNNEEETAGVLRKHSDGNIWLHTGDVGCINDGFIYFKNRIKRIIITSGYNVYPSQIEGLLSTHPLVESSCIIGVPDNSRGMRVKAYIVLKEGNTPTDEVKESISNFVKSKVSSYAKPREYEYVTELPLTKLRKVDYRELEKRSQNSVTSSPSSE